MRIMVVDPEGTLPPDLEGCLSHCGWTVVTMTDYLRASAEMATSSFDALISTGPPSTGPVPHFEQFEQLIRVSETRRVGGVLVTAPQTVHRVKPHRLINFIEPGAAPEQIRDRLLGVSGYCEMIRAMEEELDRMRFLGDRLREHFAEVDQEMRLAGRLQRDFLPRNIGMLGPARFEAIFHPVSWVSGDIYDVFQVDENHIGFYIADAVGHGMAASLLTMFIKRAIVTKRIEGKSYVVLEPSETMTLLNEALAAQDLPNSQFVTACYCLLNTRTLQLRYVRGGHPYPVLIRADGSIVELKTEGPLLGLFQGEAFPTGEAQLAAGDKVILYTDGLETAFSAPEEPAAHAGSHVPVHVAQLARHASGLLPSAFTAVEQALSNVKGSIQPLDDITLLGCEIAE